MHRAAAFSGPTASGRHVPRAHRPRCQRVARRCPKVRTPAKTAASHPRRPPGSPPKPVTFRATGYRAAMRRQVFARPAPVRPRSPRRRASTKKPRRPRTGSACTTQSLADPLSSPGRPTRCREVCTLMNTNHADHRVAMGAPGVSSSGQYARLRRGEPARIAATTATRLTYSGALVAKKRAARADAARPP